MRHPFIAEEKSFHVPRCIDHLSQARKEYTPIGVAMGTMVKRHYR